MLLSHWMVLTVNFLPAAALLLLGAACWARTAALFGLLLSGAIYFAARSVAWLLILVAPGVGEQFASLFALIAIEAMVLLALHLRIRANGLPWLVRMHDRLQAS